jgi:competence protein ComGC
MVVVLLIGILVTIAVPIFTAARSTAEEKSCFANQREIEGAAQTYRAATGLFPASTSVDEDHPLIAARYIAHPPHCPSCAELYSIDTSGTVETPADCPHGHF